jgi:hypothetical protein
MRLKCADLFSGTGGISLALGTMFKTVLYCEIDPECRAVLEKNMQRGRLERAEIVHDVRTIQGSKLASLGIKAITAGFPCQDAACPNPAGKGLEGKRTGLFWEIVRILDEVSLDLVFLENSACISRISEPIVSALSKRGFAVASGIIAASDVGAPHNRKRWFCLAYKYIPDTRHLAIVKHLPWFKNKEPCPRVVLTPQNKIDYRAIKRRCQMLGNAVVPQQIAFAFKTLALAKEGICDQIHSQCIRLSKQHGHVLCPRPIGSITPRMFYLIVYGQQRDRWCTPTHTDACCQYTVKPTYRRLHCVLSEMVYHEKDTFNTYVRPEDRGKKYIINPCFIEYLMGFPKDWTLTT